MSSVINDLQFQPVKCSQVSALAYVFAYVHPGDDLLTDTPSRALCPPPQNSRFLETKYNQTLIYHPHSPSTHQQII